jgi:formate C-acetyltransferase
VPIGRLDQILYPYYKNDKEVGKITAQEAAELLGALWAEDQGMRKPGHNTAFPACGAGLASSECHSLRSQREWRGLTNEISWLVLEVMAQVKLSEPAVYIRYNPDMDPEFIRMRFAAMSNSEAGTRHS